MPFGLSKDPVYMIGVQRVVGRVRERDTEKVRLPTPKG